MITSDRKISFILDYTILISMPANDNDHLVSYISYLRQSMPEWERVMIADWDKRQQYYVTDIWTYMLGHGMVNNDD